MLLSRVRHGLWSIRERCSCWPFSSHIPLSKNNYLFPFHLEKNLNFQRYNFLIGILDVFRIPWIYLNAKINFITSLRLLFNSESMCESSSYIKHSMSFGFFKFLKKKKKKKKNGWKWWNCGIFWYILYTKMVYSIYQEQLMNIRKPICGK